MNKIVIRQLLDFELVLLISSKQQINQLIRCVQSPKAILLIVLTMLLISGCKKDDPDEYIVITTSKPLTGSVFGATDAVEVRGLAAAGSELTKVTMWLADRDRQPVGQVVSLPAESEAYTIQSSYQLEGFYLETGNYFIAIRAQSLHGGDVTEYVPIVLDAIPRESEQLLVTVDDGAGAFSVAALSPETGGQMGTKFTGSGNYVAGVVSSRFRTFIHIDDPGGEVKALDIDTWDQRWSRDELPDLLSITMSNEIAYYCVRDGAVIGIDVNGMQVFGANREEENFEGVKAWGTSDFVYVLEKRKVGTEKRFVTYFPTGAFNSAVDVDFDVVTVFELAPGRVVLFGNENGVGKILEYAAGETSFEVKESGGVYLGEGEINDVAQLDSERFMVLMKNRILEYRAGSSASLRSLAYDPAVDISFQYLAYDPGTERVYVAFSSPIPLILRLTYDSGTGGFTPFDPSFSYEPGKPIIDLNLQFNK